MPAPASLLALLSQPTPRTGAELADLTWRTARRRSVILIAAVLPFVLLGREWVSHPRSPLPWPAFALFGAFSVAIIAFWISQVRAVSKLLRTGALVPATVTRRAIGTRGGHRVRVEFELDGSTSSFNSIVPRDALSTESAACHVLVLRDERLACAVLGNELRPIERFTERRRNAPSPAAARPTDNRT